MFGQSVCVYIERTNKIVRWYSYRKRVENEIFWLAIPTKKEFLVILVNSICSLKIQFHNKNHADPFLFTWDGIIDKWMRGFSLI